MLASIRKALSSWVVVGLLALLVAAFVLTSVQDPFSLGGGARLAKVGDKTISAQDFTQQFERIFRLEQRERPELTRADVIQAGADRQVLSLLITASAFEAFAEKVNVAAGPRNLTNAIRSNPAFQIAGQFDQPTYEGVLQQNNITRQEYQRLLAAELTRDHFVKTASFAPVAPEKLVDTYVRLLQEARTASIAVVPAQKFAASIGTPDDKTLEAFYKENIAAYTVPELRSFRYLLLNPEAIEPTIKLTEADLKQYYDAHADLYAGAEKRAIQQLLLADEATARAAYNRIQKGEDFAKVAADVGGFEESDLSLGELTREQLAKDTSEAAASAAFGMPQGTVTSPVESELGWHLFRTTGITRVEGRPFEAVKDEITRNLRRERAIDRLYELSREIEDALANGDDFAVISKTYNLPLVTVPSVTRFGQDKNGQPVALAPQVKAMLGQVFDMRQDEDPMIHELEKDVYYVAQIESITPPTPRPLAEIKDQVTANWRADQMLKKAKAETEAIIAAVKKGQSLDEAVRKQGLEPARPLTVRRIDAMQRGDQLPPPVRAMFSVRLGEVEAVPAPGGQGFFLVKVENIETRPGADAIMLKVATQQEIQGSAEMELASAFAQAIRSEVGVKINEAALRQVRSQLLSGSAE